MSVSPCVTTTQLPNGHLLSYTRLHMDPDPNDTTIYHSTIRVPQRKLDPVTYYDSDAGRDFTYSPTTLQVTIDSLSPGLNSAAIPMSIQAQNLDDYTQVDVFAAMVNADADITDYWVNLTVIGPAN